MFESKEFRSSVMPVIIVNSAVCTGLLEYFTNRYTHLVGFVYAIVATSLYSMIFYTLLDMIHESWREHLTDFAIITIHFQFWNNIVVYVSTILAGVLRRKQVRLSMKHLENCARAMDELGIPGSYSAMVTHKYLVASCISLIMLSTSVGEFQWLTNSHVSREMLTLYCFIGNIPPIASFVVDFSFIYWIRYAKIKIGQLNTVLRSMLTTTIESPQHRRVLRVRDKWKGTSPSSNIYRNYKANENIKKLKRIKEIHLELIKFARNMNEAYGFHILMSMTTCFLLMTTLLYNLYVAMILSRFTLPWANVFAFAYWTVFLGFEVIAVNHICAITAMETGDILCEMYEPSTSKEFRKSVRVREFVQQLVQNPLTFSACGFFDLDHTFINSTIGSVTTYLVILIQVGHGSQNESKNTTQNTTSTI